MVFLNYSTMQMVAKIVYYGPGLCGKTTNLKEIYKKTSPRSRGEMVSLETETDRTLFFDLLPMDVGVVGGFKTKFQLYTVPGQVFYNATRKLVLRGVDGIVFVADSQKPMLEANRNSYENLVENLLELDVDISDIPLVFQFNKRDLPNIASIDELNKALNNVRRPFVEAAALKGLGVFETLKEISKQTLVKLRVKAIDDLTPEPVVALPVKQANSPEEEITFKVRDPKPTEEKNISSQELLADDGDQMPDDVSFEETDKFPGREEPGLPDVTSEINTEDSFGTLEDDLTDFDLDFSEEDDLEDDSITLEELDDSLEAGLELMEEGNSLEASIDDTQPSSMGLDREEAPTVHLDIPLNLDESEDLPEVVDDIFSMGSVNLEEDDVFQADPAPTLPPPVKKQVSVKAPVKPVAAKVRPKKSGGTLSSSLEALESFATQTISGRSKISRPKTPSAVESFLDDLVSPDGPKAKPDKFHIRVPSGFCRAQMNCVFLDENDNVLHTQMVKVNSQELSSGKHRIRMILDVETEPE